MISEATKDSLSSSFSILVPDINSCHSFLMSPLNTFLQKLVGFIELLMSTTKGFDEEVELNPWRQRAFLFNGSVGFLVLLPEHVFDISF